MVRGQARRKGLRRFTAAVVACLLVSAAAARQAGFTDALVGVLLSIAVVGLLSWLAAASIRGSRIGILETSAWALGLAVSAAGPVLGAVWVGSPIATGQVAAPGDALPLSEGRGGRILLLVSASVPEPGQVAFALRAGGELISGELYRGTRRWSVGEESGHSHVDRASVVIPAVLPGGRVQLVLERSTAPATALALTAYREWLPTWFPALAALCALLAFAWRVAPMGGGHDAIVAAAIAVLMGLTTGTAATPVHAMRAALHGLLVALFGGIALGALLANAATKLLRVRLHCRHVKSSSTR